MLGLTGFFGLTRISQIPRYCFVGGKSHRWLCGCGLGSRIPLVFGLTQISQIPRYCFVGGKSHRCFCGCGLVPWGCLGLALTDLFFGPFRPFGPFKSDLSDKLDGLDIFKKIIREICGICVRTPWDWGLCEASVHSVGAGDKITKNCVIWGVF